MSRRFLPLALAGLCMPLQLVFAQGWMEIESRRSETPAGPVTRVGSKVRIEVEDRMALVQVEERFRNDGPLIAEGSYLYPLAGEASFSGFSLWADDEELRGETMEAGKARDIYESIVRRRKDPALLTLAGHGLVRAQVFPIQPGETRRVALRYTQLLQRQGDALRLRYALGVRGSDRETELRIELQRGERYGTPYSPTHTIESRRDGERLVVTVAPGAAGDLDLLLPLRRPVAGATLLTHAPGGEDGYFMLLLAPGPARPMAMRSRAISPWSWTSRDPCRAPSSSRPRRPCSRRWAPSARTTGSASSRSRAPCGRSGSRRWPPPPRT